MLSRTQGDAVLCCRCDCAVIIAGPNAPRLEHYWVGSSHFTNRKSDLENEISPADVTHRCWGLRPRCARFWLERWVLRLGESLEESLVTDRLQLLLGKDPKPGETPVRPGRLQVELSRGLCSGDWGHAATSQWGQRLPNTFFFFFLVDNDQSPSLDSLVKPYIFLLPLQNLGFTIYYFKSYTCSFLDSVFPFQNLKWCVRWRHKGRRWTCQGEGRSSTSRLKLGPTSVYFGNGGRGDMPWAAFLWAICQAAQEALGKWVMGYSLPDSWTEMAMFSSYVVHGSITQTAP